MKLTTTRCGARGRRVDISSAQRVIGSEAVIEPGGHLIVTIEEHSGVGNFVVTGAIEAFTPTGEDASVPAGAVSICVRGKEQVRTDGEGFGKVTIQFGDGASVEVKVSVSSDESCRWDWRRYDAALLPAVAKSPQPKPAPPVIPLTGKFGLNPMVLRQTMDSPFSCYGGTWQALLALIETHFAGAVPIKEDAFVLKLTLPGDGFFTSVVKLEPGTVLKSHFGPRRGAVDGELSFVHTVAVNAPKLSAKMVDLIIYHVSKLTVEERTYKPGMGEPVVVECEWQLVSINARSTEGDEPPNPMAMARNHAAALGLPEGVGGTARVYAAEDYMAAILYWSQRAMSGGVQQ